MGRGCQVLGRVQDRHQGVRSLALPGRGRLHRRSLQALRPGRGQRTLRQSAQLRQGLPGPPQGFETANAAAQKMTTHKEAYAEVAAMRERYAKVKAVADEWGKKVDTLVKEWALLDNTVTELNAWVAKDKTSDGENQFSLEKMESTLGELKNIFKEKEKLVENL